MLDRHGRPLHVGELVSVTNHSELTIKVNWEIICFIEYPTCIDVTLKNFITGEVIFIPILDIDKEFN